MEQVKAKDNKNLKNIIALFGIRIALSGNTSITVLLSTIAAKFPDIPLTTIYLTSSAPNIIQLIVQLAIGPLIGKKISYKKVFSIGLFFYLVFGLAPFFYTENFYFLLACRFLYAIGGGMLIFANAAFIYVLGPTEGSKYVGLVSSVGSTMSIVMQMCVGPLSGISLNAAYLVHLLGIISAVSLVFFKEPKPADVPASEPVEPNRREKRPAKLGLNVKMPPVLWVYIALHFTIFLAFYPVVVSMSTFLSAKGIISVTAAGMGMSFYTGGGVIGGILYPKLSSVVKRHLATVAVGVILLGHLLLLGGNALIIFYLSYTLVGIGFALLNPIAFLYCGTVCPKENAGLMSSLLAAAATGAMSLTTPWVSMVSTVFGHGEVIMTPIRVGAVVFAVLTLASVFVDPRPKALRTKEETVVSNDL